ETGVDQAGRRGRRKARDRREAGGFLGRLDEVATCERGVLARGRGDVFHHPIAEVNAESVDRLCVWYRVSGEPSGTEAGTRAGRRRFRRHTETSASATVCRARNVVPPNVCRERNVFIGRRPDECGAQVEGPRFRGAVVLQDLRARLAGG